VNTKNFIFYLVLILLNVSFICCRKKDKDPAPEEPTAVNTPPKVYDTVRPLSYFPAFPGSYWKYQDSKNVITSYSTSLTYQKDGYFAQNPPNANIKIDTAYVPFFEGIPVWGDKMKTGPELYQPNPLITVVSENLKVGYAWLIEQSSNHISSHAKVMAKDTTVVAGGKCYFPVIMILDFGRVYNSPDIHTRRRYYAKDIGLVKEEQLTVGMQGDSVVSEKWLIDFHIGNR
jgi:hypothetical protein